MKNSTDPNYDEIYIPICFHFKLRIFQHIFVEQYLIFELN